MNRSNNESGIDSKQENIEQAWLCLKEDPFSVPEEVIKELNLDLIIRLNLHKTSLRAFPKFRSKAQKLLEKIKGVHYLKPEKSYYLPTTEVSAFLKKLRDQSLSFAVEKETGERLKETAELRAKILKDPLYYGANDLRKALLSPFIEQVICPESDEDYFTLRNYSTTQLREIFPDAENFTQRQTLVRAFSADVLFRILRREKYLKWKLWFTKEVLRYIESNQDKIKKQVALENNHREELLQRSKYFHSLRDADLENNLFSEEGFEKKLYSHQRVAIKWLLNTSEALLGDDMGLGKTLTVLSYFDILKNQKDSELLLIICPNSLTRNWQREASQWFPSLRLLSLPQEKSEKIVFLKKLSWGDYKFNGLVINYEAIRLDYVLPKILDLVQKQKTLLCLDESQRVKSPSSQTFAAVSQLAPLVLRKVLLSGTPTPKDISDIWSQMYLIDQGERFGKNYYRWLEQIAELGTKYSDFAVKKFKPQEVKTVISMVQEVLLRRKKEDVVNLPEKIFITRDVELVAEQKKRYEQIRKELLLKVSSTNGKTFVREINNILEEYLRAVQMAVNPRLIDETYKGEPAKFKELDQLIEEIVQEKGEKVVIWTNYLGNVRELVKRYERYGACPFSGEVSTKDRDEIVKKFQNESKNKIIIAVPAAGGVGITLTAAQTAIYLDKTWNAEHWMQSIDRIHRIGQKNTVRIISLQACRVDDLIARNLWRKTKFQNQVLEISPGSEDFGEEDLEVQRKEFLEAVKES